MKPLRYSFTVAETDVRVEAEQEGVARYMVRMSIPGRMSNVRIGYLTGRRREWLAEFFGNRPSQPAASAMRACLTLAEFAATQPGIAPYLSKMRHG